MGLGCRLSKQAPAPTKKSIQVRWLVSSLECSSNCEFEIPFGLTDKERQARGGSQVCPVNPIRIKSKYQAERCINDRHHDLKLHTRARPYTGVRSRQKSNGSV